MKKFFAQANLLKTRLGPILFQLPPSWKVNVERFEEFVRALPRRRRYAFESRNPTWNIPPIFEVLRKHNAAAYQGDYSARQLRAWAKRIGVWRTELKHTFVYFDNDHAAFAAKTHWSYGAWCWAIPRLFRGSTFCLATLPAGLLTAVRVAFGR